MADGPDIRVMSFNVLNARSGQHTGRWKNRKESAAMAVWAFGPDLLGLQECQSQQAAYFRDQLPGYGVVSAGRDEGLFAGESVAIFYRADRFEKLEEGHFWLSKRPDAPGSRNWGTIVPRIVSWARLRDRRRPDLDPLVMYNTHFDPFSRWARFRSAETLRRRIVATAGRDAAIVTGDFNANAGRKLHQVVLNGTNADTLRLYDSYRLAHPTKSRGEGTWHGRGIRLPRRIDWILHTDHFVVVDAYIDRAKRNGRYPSDHFPVTATLRR